MKSRACEFLVLICLVMFLGPGVAGGDQNDEQLVGLFATLQTDGNPLVQQQTIAAIWSIWYQSGRTEVDELMTQGGEAAGSGQLDEAERLFTRVTEIAPEFSEGWNRRATVRYYRLDYDGSLADIERTLALEPRHFGAYWGRGMILGLRRDFAGAIEAFENMRRIAPFSAEASRRLELLRKEMLKDAV